jgi:hypothetical protein
MKSLLSKSLDIVDEVIEGNIEKIAQVTSSLSDDAKSAYIPSMEEQEIKDDNDFALVLFHPHTGTLNKYAKYTPELTEINMAYLAEKQNDLPEEIVKIAATNLTCAANNYDLDIPESLEKYASKNYINNIVDVRDINELAFIKKSQKVQKTELYAWPEEKKYPIDTDINIKKAASYFEKHASEMEPIKRLEFATNVKKAADKLEISLDRTNLLKEASISNASFNPEFFDHVQIRKGYLKDYENNEADEYDALLKEADALGPINTAARLYELDKKAGLHTTYNHGIEDPIKAAMCSSLEKEIEIDGVLVKESDLKKIADSDLTPIVGNSAIKDLKSDEGLDVLNSLPKPVRQEILNLL